MTPIPRVQLDGARSGKPVAGVTVSEQSVPAGTPQLLHRLVAYVTLARAATVATSAAQLASLAAVPTVVVHALSLARHVPPGQVISGAVTLSIELAGLAFLAQIVTITAHAWAVSRVRRVLHSTSDAPAYIAVRTMAACARPRLRSPHRGSIRRRVNGQIDEMLGAYLVRRLAALQQGNRQDVTPCLGPLRTCVVRELNSRNVNWPLMAAIASVFEAAGDYVSLNLVGRMVAVAKRDGTSGDSIDRIEECVRHLTKRHADLMMQSQLLHISGEPPPVVSCELLRPQTAVDSGTEGLPGAWNP